VLEQENPAGQTVQDVLLVSFEYVPTMQDKGPSKISNGQKEPLGQGKQSALSEGAK
jgi:hypothetical protein